MDFSNNGRVRSFSGRALNRVSVARLDPYSYTSGRWLRNDKHERQIRQIDFDFERLCRKIVDLSKSTTSIRKYEKKEGGFNRVFIFTMNDNSRIVARLPFTFAGPARLATASEVATIQYLQRKTSIPIPKILDWSDDAGNSVGSEYIIMEHAAGVSLQQKWPYMSGEQKVRCIDGIHRKLKEMTDINFPAYGCLYLSTTQVGSASRIPLDSEICIGPHCGTRYWDCGDRRYYQYAPPNRGPWLNIGAYSDGLIDAGLSRVPPRNCQSPNQPFYHGSIPAHLTLLEQGRRVLDAMTKDSRVCDAAKPTLFHPDLHKRNIFVSENDPSIITSIIDWQSSSIEPAFWYADEIPDFAAYAPSPSTQEVNESELCAKTYEASTQFLMPKLAQSRLMDEGMFRPFRYCYRIWKDGTVAFRHELIETSKEWEKLGFSGSCPFALPTIQEIALHQKEYRRFEAAQNLKRDLSGLLDCETDGWVPPENWETTKRENEAKFKGMLNAVLTNKDPDDDEPVRNERDLRDIWPFDLPHE